MTKEEIYKIIYQQQRLKFKTKTEFAQKMGISPQNINNTMKKMENNGTITFDNLIQMIEALDLELILQEKKIE